MSKVVAWAVFLLGAGHILFGVMQFQAPLLAAVTDGFIGQFAAPEIRRTAFWFVMVGPLVMLVGHLAIHAVRAGDFKVLKVIGIYMLIFSAVGVAAFPVSPLWAPLLLSLLLLAIAYRLI